MCVFWHDKKKKKNPEKSLWNDLLTVCDATVVRSSTASSFNKCFFVNSPWHCASFTKQNTPINPQKRSRMPLKINYPLVPCAGSLLISVQRCERAVQTKRVKANVLSLHLSNWWQTQAHGLCQKVTAFLPFYNLKNLLSPQRTFCETKGTIFFMEPFRLKKVLLWHREAPLFLRVFLFISN